VEENATIGAVVRNLGSAWRAARLYPSGSPMTVQAAEAVCEAVEEYIQAEPSLKLDVVREGFVLRGLDGVLAGPGVPELVDALGAHGVGELHFVAPPTPEEVIALLNAAQMRPHELQAHGGMGIMLSQQGVGGIKVIALVLSKVEAPPEIPEEEADKFFAELAADAGRLAEWLRALLAFDDEGLIEGILTLATASGDVRVFGRTMAAAFAEQDSDAKDRLLEVSMELEPVREVMVEMLANVSSVELTAAIRGGRYGTNLMSLSYALTKLPVGERAGELLRETEAALSAADVGETETLFLERMIGVRRETAPEPPLVDVRPIYRSVLESARVPAQQLAAVEALISARHRLDPEGVATVMRLLETADDFEPYCHVLEALASSVPHLFEVGDGRLAMTVVREIARLSLTSGKPWPDLHVRLEAAIEEACGTRSMSALLALYSTDDQAVEYAKELVTLGGEKATSGVATAALASEAEDAMTAAEAVLGRRLPELLAPEAPRVDSRHAARLAELFARDGGPWCMQALAQLVARPEDRVRSETARGIGEAGGQVLFQFMPKLLRDESYAVAVVSARVLAHAEEPGAVEMLATRLGEFEGEKDLPAARYIIALLVSSTSKAVDEALTRIADQRAFMRKGWHVEMKRLAREALDARKAKGLG